MVTIPAQAPSYVKDFAAETRENLFTLQTRLGVAETALKRLGLSQQGQGIQRRAVRTRALAANETLLVSDFDTVQIINCTSPADIVLMPAELGRWVLLLNEGASTATVKDGATTLCTLPTDTLCLIHCRASATFVPSWPTKVETWKADGTLTLGVPLGITSGGTGLSSLGTSNQVPGMDATATGMEWKTVRGTTNQVTVTHTAGNITMSTPQDIHTSATPTFSNLTLSARTTTRVAYFTTGGAFTDSANMTFNGNQLALAATGSSGGILCGGDAQLYRSAANTWTAPDHLFVQPPTNTATSGTIYGMSDNLTTNPGSATSGSYYVMGFSGSFGSNNNYTGILSAVIGSVTHTGSGTVTNTELMRLSFESTSTGTLTNGWGARIYGPTVSTGSTVTTWRGVSAIGPRASGAGTVTSAYLFAIEMNTVSGTGAITTMVGFDCFSVNNMTGGNAFTANNQTRIGIDIGPMPDPGAYTGTTVAAIRFNTSTAADRNGLLWSTDVRLYRSASATLATNADFSIVTAGKTLKIAEGTNCKMGSATLVGGTVTVNTTAVTATSRIFLSNNANGGTVGALYVSARTAGTSFVITSTSGTDTSTVSWLLLEPA